MTLKSIFDLVLEVNTLFHVYVRFMFSQGKTELTLGGIKKTISEVTFMSIFCM